MSDDLNYDELDPGIREVVRWLRSEGFETCDSGDGVTKVGEMGCAVPYPHVFCEVDGKRSLIDAADRMHRVVERRIGEPTMTEKGPSWMVQADYSPGDGTSTVSLIGVTDAMLAQCKP